MSLRRRPVALILVALVLALALTVTVTPAAHAQTWTQVTVQRGDTLARIAVRFCTTWREIYDLNRATIGPNPNYIRRGMVLTVPNRCDSTPVDNTGGIWDRGARLHSTGVFTPPWYSVAQGDTLTSIAQRFGTTLAVLRSQNGISGSFIYPGQVLLIGGGQQMPPVQPAPVPLPPPAVGERVSFEPNAISASRTGAIADNQSKQYVLRAAAGQQMSLFTTSFGAPLSLQLTSPTGQEIELSGSNSGMENGVAGWLPVAGDYTVTVWPLPDGGSPGSFNFNITFVIQ